MRDRPICDGCKHYNGDDTCKAFPQGIPAVILLSELDHRRPVRGDNGIRFEARSPADAQYADSALSLGSNRLPDDVR